MLTIESFEREHRRLCREVAALRFELRLRRFVRDQKYSADQPRDDWGRWTNGGGGEQEAASQRMRLAGDIPTGEPPDIPKERPPTAAARTAAIKAAARYMARYGAPLLKVAEAAYWLYQYDYDIEASVQGPKSLEELQQDAAKPQQGYQIHHIVAAQDGYPRTMIEDPDNRVRIPSIQHREITGWYQTRNEDFGGLSPRDYLRGRTWEERRQVGLDALVRHRVLNP